MSQGDDPGAVGSSATGQMPKGNATSIARREAAHKWRRTLFALLQGPHDSFQLERDPVYDHCPNSTVSDLKKRGVEILAEMIEVRGYAGIPTRIARYSLTGAGREAARRLLAS